MLKLFWMVLAALLMLAFFSGFLVGQALAASNDTEILEVDPVEPSFSVESLMQELKQQNHPSFVVPTHIRCINKADSVVKRIAKQGYKTEWSMKGGEKDSRVLLSKGDDFVYLWAFPNKDRICLIDYR